MTVTWRPFALRPQYDPTPFRFRGSYVENAWRKASALAEPDGLTYRLWPDDTEYPRWSLPGLEAGAAAQKQAAELGEDVFLRFHAGLYRAFFIDNRSPLDKDTALAVARQVGLDTNAFLRDLEDEAFRASVRAQCQDAMDAFFVSAVPTVLIGVSPSGEPAAGAARHIGLVPAEDYVRDLEKILDARGAYTRA